MAGSDAFASSGSIYLSGSVMPTGPPSLTPTPGLAPGPGSSADGWTAAPSGAEQAAWDERTAHAQVLPGSAVGATPTSVRVVFVPGLGLDERSWQKVRSLLNGPSVVEVLPSMGEPAPRSTDLSVDAQARRLVKTFAPGTPLILVGHSASCPVVVQAAAVSPDVVGLVLVGPVTDPAARTWPRMLAQWLRSAAQEHPAEAAVLLPQYWRTGPAGMLRGMNAIRWFRTDLTLAGQTLPVDVVRGVNDRIATRDWSAYLRQVSRGTLTSIVGGGHMVPLTHPAAIVAAIERVRSSPRRGPTP